MGRPSRWTAGLDASEIPSDIIELTKSPLVVLAVVCEECRIPCRPNGMCDLCQVRGTVLAWIPRQHRRRVEDPKMVLRREALRRCCPQCDALPGTPCVALGGLMPGAEIQVPHSTRFYEYPEPNEPWWPHWAEYEGKTRQADLNLREWLRTHGGFLAPRTWVRRDR